MYTINDKLYFGKCYGETIADIYQYSPSYIEWLINCHNDFLIDINDFKNLPTPTPFLPRQMFAVGDTIWGLINEETARKNPVKAAKEMENLGVRIPEKNFSFSSRTLKALEEKLKGTFISKCGGVWDEDDDSDEGVILL